MMRKINFYFKSWFYHIYKSHNYFFNIFIFLKKNYKNESRFKQFDYTLALLLKTFEYIFKVFPRWGDTPAE